LRVRIAFLLICLFALSAIGRIVHLQTAEDNKWAKLGNEIDLQYKTVQATRGNIYSDNGSLLATSLPFYRLAFDPTIADEALYRAKVDSLCRLLSRHFGDYSATHYKRKIHNARLSGRQYIILNRQVVQYQHKKMMMEWPIFREGRLGGGIIFEKVDRRVRPFSYLGYRTIGFVNDNNDGAGLEYSFNRELAGVDGKALYQKMAGGAWRPLFDGSEIRPQEGLDIETTIDVNLQDVTESALLSALKEHGADYGCAVVMEVHTGEIKAISNLTFSEKHRDYREIYNYAVQGLHEPGSTFKLLSMIALLDKAGIELTDSIDTGDGAYRFYNSVMRDHKPGGFGRLSVREVFEYSSNIGISKLVYDHFEADPESFLKELSAMGIDKPLGFQMVGEGVPVIKSTGDKSWSGTTLPWMSIGYEVQVTPLQMLAVYNAVANGGKMIKPIIVKNVRKADQIIESYSTSNLTRSICSKRALKDIQSLLIGVVENGTASNIRNPHYRIAGKTGTAQKIVDGRYTRQYNTSFVGYFPAGRPRYSCIVVIDSPKGFRQYASSVAAPVFKEIADKIYSKDLDLHAPVPVEETAAAGVFPLIRSGRRADLDLVCSELNIPHKSTVESEWVHTDIDDNAVLWTTNEIAPEVVPDVLGMTLRDAIFLLENLGLEVSYKGRGRVVTQSLPPGTRTAQHNRIILNLG
jgi:cell division protein FtsI (penicillin-binding protein 3)